MSSESAALVLAAGASSRMGRDKALLKVRGQPFLTVILENLRAAGFDRITVVLGHHAEEIRRSVGLEDANVVLNPDYRTGQTSSLQAGLRSLATEVGSILLCLVDHPVVSPEVMQQLCALYRESGAPLVIPTFRGWRGHPVLIGRQLFKELLALSPGEGANTVVQKYYPAARWLEVEDQGVTFDVDTLEDYERLMARLSRP